MDKHKPQLHLHLEQGDGQEAVAGEERQAHPRNSYSKNTLLAVEGPVVVKLTAVCILRLRYLRPGEVWRCPPPAIAVEEFREGGPLVSNILGFSLGVPLPTSRGGAPVV